MTVAPITGTVRGIGVEVPVGPAQGLDHHSVVNFEHITMVDRRFVAERIGALFLAQGNDVLQAIREGFGLLP